MLKNWKLENEIQLIGDIGWVVQSIEECTQKWFQRILLKCLVFVTFGRHCLFYCGYCTLYCTLTACQGQYLNENMRKSLPGGPSSPSLLRNDFFQQFPEQVPLNILPVHSSPHRKNSYSLQLLNLIDNCRTFFIQEL